MSANVKLGVVGFGSRGSTIAANAFRATGGMMETAACVDASEEKYNASVNGSGIKPVRYGTIKEMLKTSKLDGVIISSPNEFHLENLLEFKGMSIPLLLEKPLDSSYDKICKVVEFSEKYKGPIMIGHCMRYAPILQKSKELLDGGAIGRICSTQFVQNCHYGTIGYHNWRRNRKKSGTWMIEKATHDLDIMFWLLGQVPEKVIATAKLHAFGGNKSNTLRCSECKERVSCPESFANILNRWGVPIEEMKGKKEDFCVFAREADSPDNEMCLMQFGNGIFGTYTQRFFTPVSYHHRIYEIIGTDGAMEIDLGVYNGKITICPRTGAPEDRTIMQFDYLKRNHYNGDGEMTKHFYMVITGKEKPFTTVKQAFLAETTGFAAIESSFKDEYVRLDRTIPKHLQNIIREKPYQYQAQS